MYFDRGGAALFVRFMKRTIIKAWITKQALESGSGIKVVNAEFFGQGNAMISYGRDSFAFGKGEEWHLTEESALARAEEMRLAEIVSLKERIAKLEALDVHSLLP